MRAAPARLVGGPGLRHRILGNDFVRVESELTVVVGLDPIEVGARHLHRGRDAVFHVAAEPLNRLVDHVVLDAGLRFRRLRHRRLGYVEGVIVPHIVVILVVALVVAVVVGRADFVIKAVCC